MAKIGVAGQSPFFAREHDAPDTVKRESRIIGVPDTDRRDLSWVPALFAAAWVAAFPGACNKNVNETVFYPKIIWKIGVVGSPGSIAMNSASKALVQFACLLLPWAIRRPILNGILGFRIHPTAHIGLSIILADEVELEAKTIIGHFNYIGTLDRLIMREEALISRFNWVTGLAKRLNSPFFKGKTSRKSEFILGRGSNVANWHLIDCTDTVEFGEFCSLAGSRSQLLTHGIDVMRMKQSCSPISIGSNTMLGTGVIVLKGVSVASCCVVAAGSVLTKSVREPLTLVAGNPAEVVRKLPADAKYFSRTNAVMY